MATHHGGDLFDLPNLTDDELRQLVVQQLREYPNLDAEWIEVDVRDGFVTLSGRVGTDAEIQVAEAVLHDVIGIQTYSNDLVLDELHRGESPQAVDEHLAHEEALGEHLGEADAQQSDTAAHLTEDLEAEAFGTHDMEQSIQEGMPYIPPDRPGGDGYGSREDH